MRTAEENSTGTEVLSDKLLPGREDAGSVPVPCLRAPRVGSACPQARVRRALAGRQVCCDNAGVSLGIVARAHRPGAPAWRVAPFRVDTLTRTG